MTSLSDNPNTVLPRPQQILLPEGRVAVSQLSCASSFWFYPDCCDCFCCVDTAFCYISTKTVAASVLAENELDQAWTVTSATWKVGRGQFWPVGHFSCLPHTHSGSGVSEGLGRVHTQNLGSFPLLFPFQHSPLTLCSLAPSTRKMGNFGWCLSTPPHKATPTRGNLHSLTPSHEYRFPSKICLLSFTPQSPRDCCVSKR